MVARGHRGTIGATRRPATCRVERRAFSRAVAVLRILATARETGLDSPNFDARGAYSPDDASHIERPYCGRHCRTATGHRRYVVGEQIPLLALSRRTRDPLLDIVSPI